MAVNSLKSLKARFLFFGRNSGIHGLNHLFKENAIFLARLFWLTIIVVSAGCVYLLLVPVIRLDGGINYTPDTLYLNWTSTFPGVTVCDLYSSATARVATKKLQEFYHGGVYILHATGVSECKIYSNAAAKTATQRLEELYRTLPRMTVCDLYSTATAKTATQSPQKLYPELLKPLTFDQVRHVIDLLHGRGKCTARRCFPCGSLVPCDVPWRTLVEKVHLTCEQIFTDCSFLGKDISCCSVFRQVDSEFGPCYSFNSFNTLQNAEFLKEPVFTVNITTGPATLTFRLLSNSKVSIHSPEELSTENLGAEYTFPYYTSKSEDSEILFSMVEIENGPMVVHEDIWERNCRFPHEIPDDMLHTYPTYSYGACNLAKSTEHSFEHCGCISPVRDLSYQNFYCNYTGMNCLAEHDAKIKVGLESEEEEHPDEECLPSCIETEIFVIYDKRSNLPEHDYKQQSNRVTIKMASLPTLRYQRNVVRTRLDFVVSVGGMAGLFFSASVLSAVEILYLMLRSPSKSVDD